MRATASSHQSSQPLERTAARGDPMRVPLRLPGIPERMIVDTTWGKIQPIRLHPEIETVGELEVIEHLKAGLPLVDTRRREAFAAGTIPGARSLPHVELPRRIGDLDPETPAILFCNGPQCAATPNAIRILLEHGHPATMLRYYRGGIHDWLTLGLPSTPGHANHAGQELHQDQRLA